MNTRPGGLLAICIIALILGVLGFFSSGLGAVGLVIGTQMQATFGGTSEFDSEFDDEFADAMAEAQAERETAEEVEEAEDESLASQFDIYSDSMAVQKKYLPALLGTMFGNVVASVLLAAGALMILLERPVGRRVMLWGLGIALLIDVVKVIPNAMMQAEIMPLTTAGMPAGMGSGIQTFMTAMLVFQIGFMALWALALAVYYIIAIIYLRKPKTLEYFAAMSADADPVLVEVIAD